MGDSACLVHGLSYAPALSDESKQGNIMYALTDSVSFGKFMTESLSWERWSTFTHRKYVEEAKRYSQPGSVAQKKAFFEAHYKGLSAKKGAVVYDFQIQDSASIVVGNSEPYDEKLSPINHDSSESIETPKIKNNMLENSVSREDDESVVKQGEVPVPPAFVIPVAPQENDTTDEEGRCATECTPPEDRDKEQPPKGGSGCRIPSSTRAQNERMNTLVDLISSTSGHKWHGSNSSPIHANTPQSLILYTPSTERKQKVEEKFSTNEVKNVQLQKTRKEKKGKRFGILSCGFCFRPRFDFEDETDNIQKDLMKKTPVVARSQGK